MRSRKRILKQDTLPNWATAAAWLCVAAAAPTVLWRVLLGLGWDLGTPAQWRAEQQIPGPGSSYVLTLAALQLGAALLAVRMVRPDGDRVPHWVPLLAGRRAPAALVGGLAFGGAAILLALCAMSMWRWSWVNPFDGAPASLGNAVCTAAYLAVLLWPPALIAATLGYLRGRLRERRCTPPARVREM
ncbi:hypothetical protein [Nocardia sp. NPDC050717]|uniref:hypothetical protein n=1 Tax=Nocardia sp. NPDC050717 TaxID=3157221 RepID=UPI0033F549D6